jgi:hypothetical protein
MQFDLKPLADALAERGRVVVRRAYADWSYFDEDRRMLTQNHVELIEIPQRMGAVRKNAADIKMAVDAVELSFERDYITTFVICTGDSDFTPLVDKLRSLNKRVIGVGLQGSTSKMLPPGLRRVPVLRAHRGRRGPERKSRAAEAAWRRAGPGPSRRGEDRRRVRSRRPPCKPSVEEVTEEDDDVRGHQARARGPEQARHADAVRPAALQRRRGARLDAEAGDAAQGPDVQRGGLRLPGLRRAAPPPGEPQGHRAVLRRGEGRSGGRVPRGRPAARTRRSPCCTTSSPTSSRPAGPRRCPA